MFEWIFVKWVKAVGVEAGGCAVGGPTTVAGISVSQVWSSRFLSMNSGHQMALSLSFQSQGLNYLWPCVHLHLCVCVWEQLQLSCAIFQWKNIMPVTTTSWTTLKLCTPLTRCEMESVCVGCVSVNRNIQFSCPETEKHNRESALSLLAYRSELAFTRKKLKISLEHRSVSLDFACVHWLSFRNVEYLISFGTHLILVMWGHLVIRYFSIITIHYYKFIWVSLDRTNEPLIWDNAL